MAALALATIYPDEGFFLPARPDGVLGHASLFVYLQLKRKRTPDV